jgi:hypothetical protein
MVQPVRTTVTKKTPVDKSRVLSSGDEALVELPESNRRVLKYPKLQVFI